LQIILNGDSNHQGFPALIMAGFTQGGQVKLQVTVGKEITYVVLEELSAAAIAFKAIKA
jgi:hypothetical protein